MDVQILDLEQSAEAVSDSDPADPALPPLFDGAHRLFFIDPNCRL